MSRATILSIALLTVALSVGNTQAQVRLFVGARHLAMGGTGVGDTSDALAGHYNPAGMAFAEGWDISLPLATIDGKLDSETLPQLHDLVNAFERQTLTEIQERFDAGEATFEDLQTVLGVFLEDLPRLAETEDGVAVRAVAGLAYRWRNWGVSTHISGIGGLDTFVDLTTGLSLSTLGLGGAIPDPVEPGACGGVPTCLAFADELVQETGIDEPRAEVIVVATGDTLTTNPAAFGILTDVVNATTSPDGPTLADNPSEVTSTGLLVSHVVFTYSRLVYRERLAIGANVKLMRGRAFEDGIRVADLNGDDELDELLDQDNATTDTELGIDLGLMYRPTARWSIGIAADNLNSPRFELSRTDRRIEFSPVVRAGAAYRPMDWFNVALDLDLNRVESGVVRRLDYQYANIGVEFLAGRHVAGRLGAYRNLAGERAKTVFTGGIGLQFDRFSIDLSVGAATNRQALDPIRDGRTLPEGFAASIQFGWRSRPNDPDAS